MTETANSTDAESTGAESAGAAAAGDVVRGNFVGAAGARPWRLFIPTGARTSPMLLVILHGCTQNANDIAAGTRMDAVAQEQGFLVLYPEQTPAANARGCWNWFDTAHQERGHGEPAILSAMTAEIVSKYGVDARQVHLIGISAGAAMATLTVAAYPEQFATLTSASGIPWKGATDLGGALSVMQKGAGDKLPSPDVLAAAMGNDARAVPTLVVHGVKDAVVSVRNADETAAQFVGLQNAMRERAGAPRLTQAPEEPVRVENGYTVREQQWRDASGAAQVVRIRIDELGHAWSGGSTAGTFADANGPDISRVVARFCAAHPMSAAR